MRGTRLPFGRSRHISEDDLSALLDAQLRGEAKARADAHLAACGACRDDLDGLSVVRSSLRELPRTQARRSFAVREADVRTRPGGRPSLLVQAMPMLSGAMVVALVAFMALVGVDLAGTGTGGSNANSTSAVSESLKSLDLPQATAGGLAAPDKVAGRQPPKAADTNNSYAAQATTEATPGRTAASVPAATSSNGDSQGHSTLRIAEAVAAALALASGGLAIAAWRRAG